MADPERSECTAVVFCGGDHRRLGRLSGGQAKSLLVAHDLPLLWRLLDQLRAAGFRRVVAATTPNLERQIADSLDHYMRTSPAGIRVEVTAPPEQRRGVLPGLRRVLAAASTTRALACLGDIFFRGNPFLDFASVDAGCDYLGVAPVPFEEELAQGGIVVRGGGDRITAVLERPVAGVPAGAARWSGVALTDRAAALADIERFLRGRPDGAPPGDFFEFQRERGRDLRAVPGPDFVNVNSPDHLLLASLYARLETDPAAGPLASRLVEAASALRRAIAGPTPEARR